jgi:ribosomal protein S10
MNHIKRIVIYVQYTVIIRGPMNQPTKFSTSPLIKHLKYKHSTDYSNFNENNLSEKS